MVNKILQISHKPPFPKTDGGCLDIAKMSSFYDQNNQFDLDIYTLSTYKHPYISDEFRQNISASTMVHHHEIDTKPTLTGAALSFVTNKSYNLTRFINNQIKQELIKLVKENKYDIIQFESIYTAQFIDFLRPYTKAKCILNAPNVEFNLWKQYALHASLIKKWYFQSLAKKLESKEISIWKKMDGIICISNEIQKTISSMGIKTPTVVLPFKIELNEYQGIPTNNHLPTFFHIGAMDWKPNQEGVSWFLKDVWPSILTKTKLHLAGKEINKKDYPESSTLIIDGYVDNAIAYMNSHDVMIVPLITGSGMRIKIIEAMALGKCVISTSKGAEGIAYTNNRNILIADTKEEFIESMNHCIENPKFAYEIGIEARKLVEKKYNRNDLNNDLTHFFNSIK